MNAVGKLGSYISRGVYTVSGPFHPFGGAVDVVVVEQQDGTFKSSPWYVRFGKFQGVLKAKEKVVSISVNGVEADFHMYLDHKGEAYFLREVDVEEADILLSTSSSGDDTDEQFLSRRPLKSKSRNYDAYESDSVTQIDISNGNIITRTNSRRSRILGLVFGRKSMKEDRFQEEGNDAGVVRTESLERAEIAADLLEVNWSTNLASSRHGKDIVSRLSSDEISEGKSSKKLPISVGWDITDSLVRDNMVDKLADHTSLQNTGSSIEEKGLIVDNVAKSANRMHVISEFASTESQIQDSVELEACPVGRCQKDQDFDETCHSYPNASLSMHENETNSIAPFLYCETSTSSTFELDALDKEATRTLCLSNGVCEHIFVETLQTTDLICETNSETETGLNAEEPSNIQEIAEKKDIIIFSNDGKSPESTGISPESMKNGFVTETYSPMVTFQPVVGSVQDVESQSIFTISTFSNSTCQPLVEEDTPEEKETAKFDHPLEPATGPKVSFGDPVQPNVLQSESSEEEQLLFGDLDDFKGNEPRHLEEPIYQHNEKEGDMRLSQVNEPFIPNHASCSSADCSGLEDLPRDAKDWTRKLKTISSECNIPATSGLQSEEVARIAKSLPNMRTHNSGLRVLDLGQSSKDSLDSDPNTFKPVLLKKDILSNIKEKLDSDLQSPKTPHVSDDSKNVGEQKNGRANIILGDSSRSFDASNGSWGVWSFPFKRSRNMEVCQLELNCNDSSDAETITNRKETAQDKKDMPKMKPSKKKIRATTPTSEQLASLNLKQGRNTIAFTFSTPMLGKQQVDARIYLWKWDTRIVISDVDGTITRSDLLGQVMPLVGVDWSQSGVAHLFSDIKENGYQMLFLSARAISQAYHTRQFLFNLKQDGKALPEGPVVISPDGLFPSLYREEYQQVGIKIYTSYTSVGFRGVVRRAPHEFKISCLEAIKALFPSDRNPFYAGFGNRDTDEISYLKVGIPKGKIFIINPKGEIVVNRRVDTKSYTSLQALVHDMFPPMSSSEQEDYNSWNYWKLPPPAIDM